MTDAALLPMNDLLKRCSRALGKIDLHGRRGVTLVSMDEIEAMAVVLATFGLVPTMPGEQPPEVLLISPLKDH
ncbi:MAG: hypothetical protein JWS10_957 [Cypionkella sp.]|uniref:hypothetical protein n=1 Tax=Cypionkella sp. TaxID=2811411 RepID=UPI00262BE4D9|nr:hypothetical protein [Cypionkella sp.]MDB5658342.1 hypothetical protein [Cypionkella sp.]